MTAQGIIREIIDTIIYIFANSSLSTPVLFATSVLGLFGLWGVFKKCGVKGWFALIPCVRDVKLGQAAGRENEGRVLAVSKALTIAA